MGAYKVSRSYFADFLEAPLSNVIDADSMIALRARLDDAGKCPTGEFQEFAIDMCITEVEELLLDGEFAEAVQAWREVYKQRLVRNCHVHTLCAPAHAAGCKPLVTSCSWH